MANPQTGVFYPPTWLFAIFPFETAYMLYLALHLVILAWGAYLLFARSVIFRVFAQIAMRTRFGNRLDHAGTIFALQTLELGAELLEMRLHRDRRGRPQLGLDVVPHPVEQGLPRALAVLDAGRNHELARRPGDDQVRLVARAAVELVSRVGSSEAVCGRLLAPGARRRPPKYARYERGRRRTPDTTMHPAAYDRTNESRH